MTHHLETSAVRMVTAGLRRPALLLLQLLLLLILATLVHPANAEVRTWDGGGATTAWSNNANWSGDVVPGAADIAYFDGTSSKAATITAAVNVNGIIITADYGGVITQNAGFSITVGATGYEQAGATFVGGTTAIDINGPWTLSNGSFTSTNGYLYISGDATVSGGSFDPTTGTVRFDGAQSISANGVSFNNVYITTAAVHTIAAGTTLTVNNTLTLNDGSVNGGTIEVRGPIAQAPGFDGGNGTLRIGGASDQTFTGTCTATTGNLPDVVIEKTGGILTLAGIIRTGNDWTCTSGTIDPGTSTLVFAGTLNITGSQTLGLVMIRGNATVTAGTVLTVDSTLTMPLAVALTVDGSVIVNDALELTDGSIAGSGALEARGSITQAATFDGGLGTLRITGTGDQTFTAACTPTTGDLPNVTIDKPSGTLTLSGVFRVEGTNWTYTAGTIDPGASKLIFDGALTISGSHDLNLVTFQGAGEKTVAAGTVLGVGDTLALSDGSIGTGTVEARGVISQAADFDGGTGALRIAGAADQTLACASSTVTGDLPDLVIEKAAGTLTLAGTIRTDNDWTYVSGTLDPGASTVIFDGALAISGSHDLNLVTFQGAGAKTLGAGTVLGVGDTLTLTDGSIATGAVEARGAVLHAADFDGGTGILRIGGAADQTLTGSCTSTVGDLPDLVIEKTGGTLTLAGTIRTSHDWTRSAGTLAPGASTLIFGGTLTITGSQTLNLVEIRGTTTVTAATTLTVNDSLTVPSAVAFIVDGTVVAGATLTLTDGTIDGSGELEARGAITQESTFDGGTGTLRINGTGAQTLTGSSTTAAGSLCNLIIAKSAGTLTLAGTIRTAGDWTYSAGGLAPGASTVVFAGAPTVTGSHALNNAEFQGDVTVAAGTTLTANGAVTLTDGSLLVGTVRVLGDVTQAAAYDGGSGTLVIGGTAAQTFTGSATETAGSLPSVEIDKSANVLTLGGTIRTEASAWRYVAGTLAPAASTLVFSTDAVISGSHALNHVVFEGSGVKTIDPGTTLTVGGTLTFRNGTLDTGDLMAQGDVVQDSSFAGGSASLTIGGTGAQTLSGGGSTTAGSLPALTIQNAGGTLTLDGIIRMENDWTYAAGIVDADTSLVVLGGSAELTSAGMTFHDLRIDADAITLGSALDVTGDFTLAGGTLTTSDHGLAIAGDWSQSGGSFWAGASVVTFDGDLSASVISAGAAADRGFHDVVVDKTGGAALALLDDIAVGGDLTLSSGTLAGTTRTIFLDGDWFNDVGSAAFVPGSGSVELRGGAQVIGGAHRTGFHDLALSGSDAKTALWDLDVSDLTLGQDLVVTPQIVRISGAIAGTGDVIGTVRRSVAGNGPFSLGSSYTTVAFSGAGVNPDSVDVTLSQGAAPPGMPAAVLRYYDVSAWGGAGWSATLRLHYRDDELNGNAEEGLALWRLDALWACQGSSGHDTEQNWIEQSGVDAFSRWTLARGGPDLFLFSPISSPQTAGQPFDLTITAADSAHVRVTDFEGDVLLTTTAGTITPALVTFAPGDSGEVTRSVVVDGAGSNRTITADDGEGHTGVSNPFTVRASAVTHFALGTVQSPVAAGAPFSLSMTARDAFGNVVTEFTGSLHLTVAEGAVTPSTIVVAAADSGSVTSSVRVGRAGTGICVHVTDDLGHAGSTNPFTVLPTSIKRFALTAIPSPQTAGEQFALTLSALDPYGNLAVDFTGTVNFTSTAGQIRPTSIVFSARDQGRHDEPVSVTLAGTGRTITAQDEDRHTGTSAPFTVIGSVSDHFAITAVPSPQQAGTPFELVVTALDRFGNLAAGFTGPVGLTTTAGDVSPTHITFTGSDAGRHAEMITVTGVGADRTVSIADSAGWTATSNPFTVTAGAAERFEIGAIPSPQIACAEFELAIEARDALDNPATGYTGTVALMATAGSVTPSMVTFAAEDQGRRTVSARVTRAGMDLAIAARDPSGLAGTSQSFRVEPGPASRILIGDISSPQVVGAAFPLALTVEDSCGNRTVTFTAPVSLTTTAGSITPATVVFTDADSGRHVASVTVTLAGNEQTIEAVDGNGHGGTSAPFAVLAGPAASLAFLQQPGGGRSGFPLIAQPIVALFDAYGNRASESTATIRMALAAGDTATLHGTTSVETQGGVATFSDLRIDRAGSGFGLVASANGLQDVRSADLEVAPGPATRLAFLVQPGPGEGGIALGPQPAIAVRDAAGNLVTSSAATVEVALASSFGSATLSGTTRVLAEAGVARFTDLSIDRAAVGYRLIGHSAGLAPAQSDSFTVRTGAGVGLAFLAHPDSGIGGGRLVPQPTVVIRDLGGNQVATDLPVTISLGANPAGGELTGSLVVAAADGLAAFGDLAIAKAGEGYRLTAAAPGLPAVTGPPFPVRPGPPARLVFTVQPGDGRGGEPLSRSPVVAITDIVGNPVDEDGAEVTLHLAGGNGTANLAGLTTASSTAGLATFSDVRIDKIGSAYTLLARAAERDEVMSQPFDIIAGDPAAMVILGGRDQRGAAGTWLAEPFLLRVVDAGTNALAGMPVRFTIEATPRFAAGQALSATEVVTDSAGDAGARLRLGDLAGTYTVAATLSSLPDSVLLFSASARERDGTGTVSLAPDWVVAGAATDLAFTIAGDERATNVIVRVQIPPEWTWSGQSSDVALAGAAFFEAAVSVSGDGSTLAPHVVTVERAHISQRDVAVLTIRTVTAPEAPGIREFVVSTAAFLGEPVPLTPAAAICVRAMAPGDANLDDEVNLLDMLWATDFVLGTRIMSAAQREAADVFPAHTGGQARLAADGRVESADIDLLERAILMQAWDDGLPLGESSGCPPTLNGRAPSARPAGETLPARGEALSGRSGSLPVPDEALFAQGEAPTGQDETLPAQQDIVLAIEEANDGLVIRLTNRIPVRGVQLNLRIEGASPTDLECRGFGRIGQFDLSWGIAQGEHRILLWSPLGASLAPGEGHILWIGADPTLYSFSESDFVVAGENNQPVATILAWGSPSDLPTAFRLYPGRPNPFRHSVAVCFDAPQFAEVKLEVFDATGRRVRALLRREADPGTHQVLWMGTDEAGRRVASGLYWCRMTSGAFTATRRLMLLD